MADRTILANPRTLYIIAAAVAVAAIACLWQARAGQHQSSEHDRWLETLNTARVRVSTEGPSLAPDELEELTNTLAVVLPEIEAAEITRLQTVRDCTEATLKVSNTSMADSPRRELRGEAFIELTQTLDVLIPEVRQSADRLGAPRGPLYGIGIVSGVLAVGLVGYGAIGRRRR